MPKKDGDITRERILKVAEELFSEKGFDATSINSIALESKVNKATIYYHFKDKQDIIISLFEGIVEEVEESINQSITAEEKENLSVKDKIAREIDFLMSKKKILTVLYMEALKNNEVGDAFFECAKIVIKQEFRERLGELDKSKRKKKRDLFYLHEFFTGFIPIINFVVFGERWAEYFKYNTKNLNETFMDAFNRSHIKSHILKK